MKIFILEKILITSESDKFMIKKKPNYVSRQNDDKNHPMYCLNNYIQV